MIRSLFDIPNLKPYFNSGVWCHGLEGPLHTLDIPPIDVQLWRYMNFAKFVSTLETRQLFFTRADKLDDSFEGAWSEPTLRQLDSLIEHGDNRGYRDVCDVGLGYEVNPADLIHEVVVSPHAPSWLTELMVRVIERYELRIPVSQSRLLGTPRWK